MSGNWISVKDRLPTSLGNKVLVSCVSEDTNDYVGFGHYEKFHGEETWFNLETSKPFLDWNMVVTHWQSLPSPAKGENMLETINGYFYQASVGKIYLTVFGFEAQSCATELTHNQVLDLLPAIRQFINFRCDASFDLKGYEIAYGIDAAKTIKERLEEMNLL
jgi:hypothetical protein